LNIFDDYEQVAIRYNNAINQLKETIQQKEMIIKQLQDKLKDCKPEGK